MTHDTGESSSSVAAKIRLVIQEPSLTQYRVPVFRELARRPGIDVKVFYGDSPGERNVQPDGFDATFVHMPRFSIGRRSMYWAGTQWRCATRRTTDVLLMDGNLHATSLVPALLRARRNGVPTILWGHGYSKVDAPWRRWPRHRAMRLATALLFYTRTMAQRFVDAGWNPQAIFVAPNSLDQNPIQSARDHWLHRPDDLAAFRRDQHLRDGPVVLFVSRLHPDNRLNLLMQAAALLKSDFPTMQIVMIGKGDDEEIRLRALQNSLGLENCVRFLGAMYDEMALAPWFLCSDVFCYPSNLGLSVLHAFGYGLPVVTSDQAEAHGPEIEALRDGENGLLYAHDDHVALARALERLFRDRVLAKKLGDEGRRTVLENYNITAMVDGIHEAVKYCAQQIRPAITGPET